MARTNSSENNTILYWLGRLGALSGAIGALLCAAGFIAKTFHFRILGLSPSNTSAQQYLELGGRCVALVSQALFPGQQNLIWRISSPETTIPGMDWDGGWLTIWWISAGFLALWAAAHWRFYPPVRKEMRSAFNISALVCALALAAASLSIEGEVMKVSARLQPFSATDFGKVSTFYNPAWDRSGQDYKELQARMKKSAGSLLDSAKKREASRFAPLFYPRDENGQGLPRRMIFFKIVWLAAGTLLLLFYLARVVEGRVSRAVKTAAAVVLVLQIVFIPANFGVLGMDCLYPVGRVTSVYGDKTVTHFPVIFLLIESSEKIVIYDRVNLMSIRYIPRSSVVSTEEFFRTSPFSNCSDDTDPKMFIPCELEAIPH